MGGHEVVVATAGGYRADRIGHTSLRPGTVALPHAAHGRNVAHGRNRCQERLCGQLLGTGAVPAAAQQVAVHLWQRRVVERDDCGTLTGHDLVLSSIVISSCAEPELRRGWECNCLCRRDPFPGMAGVFADV